MLGLALVAMFMFGSLAGTALAEEWLDNGATITSALPVDMEGTLILKDDKAGTEIECTGTGEGTAGPGSAGEVTKATATSCKRLKGFCNESPTAVAVHLPWTISFDETSVLWLTASPEPGYQVKCFNGVIEDECEGDAHLLILLPIEDPIHIEFENREADAGTCSVGGAKSGLVTGLLFVLASEAGHLLQVS